MHIFEDPIEKLEKYVSEHKNTAFQVVEKDLVEIHTYTITV